MFYIKIISANQEQAYPSLQELEKKLYNCKKIYKYLVICD